MVLNDGFVEPFGEERGVDNSGKFVPKIYFLYKNVENIRNYVKILKKKTF